jgi:hypothetical protein
VKKAILLLAALVAAFPVGHLAYDRLHVPDVDKASAEWQVRQDALARARVFLPDPPSLAGLDLSRNPGDPMPFAPDAEIDCRYQPKDTSGTTPKFDCVMANGEEVKVKYGINPEIPGEVAATRLLSALGFAADHMSIVRRVRCYGCPRSPFRSRQVAEWFFAAGVLDRFLDYTEYADFAHPAVERKLEARALEIGEVEGWAWFELPLVDASRGGASRAEIDAFKLMAVFLAHWDNKQSNQRLVCLGERGDDGPAPCASPLLMIQDAGATFGPRKVDYAGWRDAPIWTDDRTCTISMSDMPYGGATFETSEISEEGRRLLASRLGVLTRAQITTLFRSSNFPDPSTGRVGATDVDPWVEAFQQKVALITNRLCEPSPNR